MTGYFSHLAGSYQPRRDPLFVPDWRLVEVRCFGCGRDGLDQEDTPAFGYCGRCFAAGKHRPPPPREPPPARKPAPARIVRWLSNLRNKTVANGCTAGEAAVAAAKIAELVAKYEVR